MTTFRPQKNFAISPNQRADARAAITELPEGMTLLQAVQLARKKSGIAVEVATVAEVMARFMVSRTSGDLRPSSVDWYAKKLKLVSDGFGAEPMDSVTRPMLEKLIGELPVSQSTKASHYRATRALWRWAKGQHPALVGSDITEGISVTSARTDSDGAEFLPVADVERIFANLPKKHHPAAALLFFAGIRPQEIAGMHKPAMLWKHVNFEGKTVSVEASVAKTRSRRVLQGLPDALWAWLGEPGKPETPIACATSQQLIRMLQQAGGFWKFISKGRGRKRKTLKPWPHDVTRHTFASYHIAAFDDPGKAALLLGHGGNPRMLYTHYLGLATKSEAAKFWALRPTATQKTPPPVSGQQ